MGEDLMLLDFDFLYKKYNMDIKGILHIGAHYGQEYSIYKKHNIREVIFFEPLEKNFKILQENLRQEEHIILVNKALGNGGKGNKYVR